MRDDGGFTWGDSPMSDEAIMRQTQMLIAEHHAKTGGKIADMVLRDYFAGQALTGLLAHPVGEDDGEKVAQYAYEYADAMLEARKK